MFLLQSLKAYGVEGVFGRPLYFREILRLNVVKTIISAYESKMKGDGFATWAIEYPELSRALKEAEILANA